MASAAASASGVKKPKSLHQQIMSCLQRGIDETITRDVIRFCTARPGPVELGRNQVKKDFTILDIVDALCKHGKIKAGQDYDCLIDVFNEIDQPEVVSEITELIEEDKKKRLEADNVSHTRGDLKLDLQRRPSVPDSFLSPTSASAKRYRYSSTTPDSQGSVVEADSVDSGFPSYHKEIRADKLGLVLVVSNDFKNNTNGVGVAPRAGAEKDKGMLKELFQSEEYKKNYDFHLEENVTVEKIRELMGWCRDQLSSKEQQKYGSLWIFVLTHGTEDGLVMEPGIRTSKDDPADILPKDELYNKLKDKSGVPKVFVIQACRGDRYVERVEPDSASVDKPDLQYPDDDQEDTEWVEHDGISLPPLHHADTLVCHATIKGYQSARNPKKGTWYIRELIKTIKQFPHESFLDVLTETQGRVTMRNGQSHTGEVVQQVPKFNSTLRKKLFLLPRPKPPIGSQDNRMEL